MKDEVNTMALEMREMKPEERKLSYTQDDEMIRRTGCLVSVISADILRREARRFTRVGTITQRSF